MLVILDRDGVINYDSKEYIKSPDEWIAIPGSLEAIALMHQKGHTVVVATNQSGVNRGYFSLETLENIHQKMINEIEKMGGQLEGIYFCPHTPEEHCRCRKPEPGLLLTIRKDFPDQFKDAIVVGDSFRDMEAAKRARCQAALVKTGNGEYTIAFGKQLEDISVFENLLDFANQFTENV